MFIPRLESSTAFTKVPKEFLFAIEELFKEHFSAQSLMGDFIADGQIYPSEVYIRVGYIQKGDISQINFDLSSDIDTKQTQNTVASIDALLESARYLFEDYFEKRSKDQLNRNWSNFNTSETIFYKYEGTNTQLEKKANELLGDKPDEEDKLIHGELSGDIEKIVESLTQKDLRDNLNQF